MISIVIVNWNSGQQLQACIDSVLLYADGLVDKIIVVDNNSSDGSEQVAANCPDVQLVHAGKNLGFGAACNLGAKSAKSKYLLFLNPDAKLQPGALASVVKYMDDSEAAKVGVCGIKLRDEVGQVARSCTRFPTSLGLVAHALGLDRVFPRLGHFMAEWPHDQTRDVDHVIGAFYCIRRNVFEQLEGFDERFFVYLEDLDLSYRVRQLGWRVVYLAAAEAFHAGGGTSNQIKARRLFYSLRSRILYSAKHFNPLSAVAVILAALLVEPLSRSVLALARGSWSSVKETWSAYWMLLQWMPNWIIKGIVR